MDNSNSNNIDCVSGHAGTLESGLDAVSTPQDSDTNWIRQHSLYSNENVMPPKNNQSVSYFCGNIIVLTILYTYISLINKEAFDFLKDSAIYIYTVLSVVIILYFGKLMFRSFAYIILTICYLIFTLFLTQGGFGSVLTYIVSMLTLEGLIMIDFSEGHDNVIHFASEVALFVFFVLSFKFANNNFYAYLSTDVNPNSIGQFSVYAYCFWECTIKNRDSKKIKCLSLILIAVCAYTLWNCQCRGSLIVLVLYALLSMLPNSLFAKESLIVIFFVLAGIGIAFPFIYLNMYYSGEYVDPVIGNKTLFTGREELWLNALTIFEYSKNGWLIGIGSRVHLWDTDTNVHNTYFGIIVNFGITGLVLYMSYLSKYLLTVFDYAKYNIKLKKWLIVYLSTVLVLGYTETSIFWSVIFVFSNFALARAYHTALALKEQEAS